MGYPIITFSSGLIFRYLDISQVFLYKGIRVVLFGIGGSFLKTGMVINFCFKMN